MSLFQQSQIAELMYIARGIRDSLQEIAETLRRDEKRNPRTDEIETTIHRPDERKA